MDMLERFSRGIHTLVVAAEGRGFSALLEMMNTRSVQEEHSEHAEEHSELVRCAVEVRVGELRVEKGEVEEVQDVTIRPLKRKDESVAMVQWEEQLASSSYSSLRTP
jgi:hypothetical protein